MTLMERFTLLANLAEIAGVLLLFVSLVYVGVQIRQNTAATKARAGFDATHSWADVNMTICQHPELMELIARTTDPKSSLSDFSQSELLRMTFAFRGFIQRFEGQFHLYQKGHLDTDLWLRRSSILRGMLALPVLKEWWSNETRNYSSEFVAEIEKTGDSYDPFQPLRNSGTKAT